MRVAAMKPYTLYLAYQGACEDSDCGVDGKDNDASVGHSEFSMAGSTGSWRSQLRTAATVGLVLLIEVMGCRWGHQVMRCAGGHRGDTADVTF